MTIPTNRVLILEGTGKSDYAEGYASVGTFGK